MRANLNYFKKLKELKNSLKFVHYNHDDFLISYQNTINIMQYFNNENRKKLVLILKRLSIPVNFG